MEKAFPSNRQLKKLWELWTLIRWVSYKKQDLLPQYKDWCISLLRANNIQETLDLSDLQYLPTWYIKEEQVLEENDVLFCMSSGSSHLVGKNIKLPHLDNFSFGAFCSIFRLNNEGLIDSDYLSHYLHSKFYSDYITNIARGAGINNLRNSDLESLPNSPPTSWGAKEDCRLSRWDQCYHHQAQKRLSSPAHGTWWDAKLKSWPSFLRI